jgi:type I site-specific restriction endonuclease
LPSKPESFSRVQIDQALRESGGDLLDDRRVRFELDGKSGRADYVLTGDRGPLCVLEAKRPDLDPYEAKEQARGYAENLRAPFVILSNGKEHWFWNYERADQRDAFRIERRPSIFFLELLQRKLWRPHLEHVIITLQLIERRLQFEVACRNLVRPT